MKHELKSKIYIIAIALLAVAGGGGMYLKAQSANCGNQYCGSPSPCPFLPAECSQYTTRSSCASATGESTPPGDTYLQCSGPGTQTCNQDGGYECPYQDEECVWEDGICTLTLGEDSGDMGNEQDCTGS